MPEDPWHFQALRYSLIYLSGPSWTVTSTSPRSSATNSPAQSSKSPPYKVSPPANASPYNPASTTEPGCLSLGRGKRLLLWRCVELSGWGGGFSDAVTVPANYVLPLPDNVPLDVAALVEPLSVGWHAVRQSPLKEDSTVLILGGGPIGIAVILALKAKGCRKIIVSEPSTERSRLAKHFGADVVLDPRKEDVLERVREMTGGECVDYRSEVQL